MGSRGGDQTQEHEENPKKRLTQVMDDLNINKRVRAVLEDSEEEYEKPFKDANELMEMIDSLEEKNLFLIQQG